MSTSIKIDNQIALIPISPEMAIEYVAIADKNHHYLKQWLAWPGLVKTEADFTKFITHCQTLAQQNKALTYAIYFQRQLVGNITIKNIDSIKRNAELGYWLVEEAQGNGIITRACQKLLHMIFEDWQFDQVSIHVANKNLNSQQVCKRLGFVRTGEQEKAEQIGEVWLDHWIYTMNRDQWFEFMHQEP